MNFAYVGYAAGIIVPLDGAENARDVLGIRQGTDHTELTRSRDCCRPDGEASGIGDHRRRRQSRVVLPTSPERSFLGRASPYDDDCLGTESSQGGSAPRWAMDEPAWGATTSQSADNGTREGDASDRIGSINRRTASVSRDAETSVNVWWHRYEARGVTSSDQSRSQDRHLRTHP
jgi:hypothetical protein